MLSRVQSGLSQMWRFVIFLVESVQRHTYSKLLAICSVDFMVFNNSWLYYSDVTYPQKCKQTITPISINSWHFNWHFWCFKSLFCVYLSVCGYELMTSLIWQFDYLRTSSSQMFVMRKCYRDLVCIRSWARPYLLMLFGYIEEYVFLLFLYEE